MKNNLLFLIFLFILFVPETTFGQGQNYSSDHKGPFEPPFEKIYVDPSQVVTMPDGVYYCDEEKGLLKARCVLSDYDGMYVIRITHQCPCCGRCYEGKFLDEEYGCPLFQRHVHPRVWRD